MKRRDDRRLTEYLRHIVQAIERIARYTEDMDEAAFLSDEMAQDAVIRNIEVVGEASRNIELGFPEFAADRPELPLATAYRMRNAIAHGYFKVDLELVWRTVETDLQDFHSQVSEILREFEKRSS